MKVTEALENFCHKHFVFSEQHVELKRSRQTRDNQGSKEDV